MRDLLSCLNGFESSELFDVEEVVSDFWRIVIEGQRYSIDLEGNSQSEESLKWRYYWETCHHLEETPLEVPFESSLFSLALMN